MSVKTQTTTKTKRAPKAPKAQRPRGLLVVVTVPLGTSNEWVQQMGTLWNEDFCRKNNLPPIAIIREGMTLEILCEP